MSYLQQTCTQAFRDSLLALYPGLGDTPAYWRMMSYLLFPTKVEKDTGRLVIPQETLARIEDKETELRSQNYKGYRFLDAFRRDALPSFDYSGWNRERKKARTVARPDFPPEVEALKAQRLQDLTVAGRERVFLDTGKAWTRKKQSEQRKAFAAEIATMPQRHSGDIIAYQNSLDPQHFTKKVKQNLQAVKDHLHGCPEGPSLDQAWAQLCCILDEPKPFLKPVDNSDRPFTLHPSLLTVRSDVRKILTRDWYEYDLRAAQFAIIARVWEISELQAHLETWASEGTSLWDYLADSLGVDLESYKDGLKKGVYALAFGAEEKSIKGKLHAETGDSDIGRRFFGLPLIKTIYEAREAQMDKLLTYGGLTTIFDDWISVACEEDVRSALAREAQAVEVALIKPIYTLAQRTACFTVTLYSFDGVVIHYKHPNTANAWEKKIKAAVAAKADELGIVTELEGGRLT